MQSRAPAAARGAATALLVMLAALAAPQPGRAAKLVGGAEQRSIQRAFSSRAAHRRQLVISIRASTVSPSWSVVRWITPQDPRSTRVPVLHSSYYHRVRAQERAGNPPRPVRDDLARDFRVQVVYAGSGTETIAYIQRYRSVCAGQGGFTDQSSDTVSPMSWSVRYVVDLDNLLSAVRTPQGTTLVPDATFDATGSRIDAVENLSRTVQDFGCNGNPTTFNCRMTFSAGGQDPGGQLSFPPDSGVQVGLPLDPRPSGACDPDDYTLGPSLWDSHATTALVGSLRLLGGALPANPYAPVKVTWPGGSAQQTEGFTASPCQGDAPPACTDSFRWQGTVALQGLPGG
jgi:hypothetical protein